MSAGFPSKVTDQKTPPFAGSSKRRIKSYARSAYALSSGFFSSRAAAEKGICTFAVAEKIRAGIRALSLPTETEIPAAALLEALLRDKKRSGDTMNLVVPERIGSCRVEKVPVEELGDWLRLGGAR